MKEVCVWELHDVGFAPLLRFWQQNRKTLIANRHGPFPLPCTSDFAGLRAFTIGLLGRFWRRRQPPADDPIIL
jgi:hypothetical protein